MEIKINTNYLLEFLKKVSLKEYIKDVVIHANNNCLYAKFTDDAQLLYCEVYETKVNIIQEGSILIPSLKTLIAMISRSNSEIIRIASNAKIVALLDGESVGSFRADLMQSSDISMINSYKAIANKTIFNKETLHYPVMDVQYETGIVVNKSILDTILKDAKAFGYEKYKIVQKDKKISCLIESINTGEKFKRIISSDGTIGDKQIEETVVGLGLRNMVDSIIDANTSITVYIHKNSWLLTDKETFYYNLHTAYD
jgi:hypothetical protein